MASEIGDIGSAIAEWRQVNMEHVQPIKQVFAELAIGDHLAEVAMCGTDDADIHHERVAVAEALDLARLEEAEQLHLDVLVEFAEFVEEHGAAIGDLEETLVIAVGAGERSLLVAEELALGKVLRQRPAVDRNERHVGTRALRVDRSRDDFLPGTGFAGDQHAALGGADAVDELLDGKHRRASNR